MPTTYMTLSLPTVSTTVGPTWATMLNAALTSIDSHDHSTGKGAKVSQAGIALTGDLTFATNSATNLKAATFVAQSAFATSLALYTKSNDLYFRDGAANEIRLTASGGVNLAGLTIGADLDMNNYRLTEVKACVFQDQVSDPTGNGSIYEKAGDLYLKDLAGNVIRLTSGGYLAQKAITGDYLSTAAQLIYTTASSLYSFTTNGAILADIEVNEIDAATVDAGAVKTGTTLTVEGGIVPDSIVTVSSTPHALAATTSVALVNTGTAKTIQLPAGTAKRMLWVKDSTGTANTNAITLDPNGGDTIEGANANRDLTTNWGAWLLVCDGAGAWYVL